MIDRLLVIGMEEQDVKVIHRITKNGEEIHILHSKPASG